MKGFIFSTEASLTIVLLLLVASTLWITTPKEITNKNQLLDSRLTNTEMITLYFNKTVEEQQGNFIQKCTELYYYDSNKSEEHQTPLISQKIICEGIK